MKNLTRIIALLLVFVTLLTFAACETKKKSSDDEEEDETEESSTANTNSTATSGGSSVNNSTNKPATSTGNNNNNASSSSLKGTFIHYEYQELEDGTGYYLIAEMVFDGSDEVTLNAYMDDEQLFSTTADCVFNGDEFTLYYDAEYADSFGESENFTYDADSDTIFDEDYKAFTRQ